MPPGRGRGRVARARLRGHGRRAARGRLPGRAGGAAAGRAAPRHRAHAQLLLRPVSDNTIFGLNQIIFQ